MDPDYLGIACRAALQEIRQGFMRHERQTEPSGGLQERSNLRTERNVRASALLTGKLYKIIRDIEPKARALCSLRGTP